MDYASLTGTTSTAGSIASWLNHASLVGAAPTIIAEAEAFIYPRLKHWQMLTETTLVFASIGNDFIGLPSDFISDKTLYVLPTATTGLQKQSRDTIEQVKARYQYNGLTRTQQMPRWYYNNNTNLKFDSPVDQAYSCELSYYQRLEGLAISDTNFLTIYYPRLLRCACMIGASEFMKDMGVGNYDRTYWVEETEKEIVMAQSESDSSARSSQEGFIMT